MTYRTKRAGRTITTAALTGCLFLTAGSPALTADGPADLPAPGHYEVSTTTSFSDGTLPQTTVTTQNCLTEEDLQKDPASVFADLPEGKSCQVAGFVMEGGDISMRISCTAADGNMVMVINGTYQEETYEMVSEVVVSVGEQQVTMHSTIDGRRVGDC